jgi:hypothetical protein
MKRKFIKIANYLGVSIDLYKTYRSDMGCQVYEIIVSKNGVKSSFDDGYYPPESGAQDKILSAFSKQISEFLNRPNGARSS